MDVLYFLATHPHLLGLVFLGISAGLSYVLVPYTIPLCRKLGMVAEISNRRSHKIPTPHGGGMLMPLIVTPLGLAFVGVAHPPFSAFLAMLLTAGLFVAAVGWRDDRSHVDPRLRLAVHLPAVAVALVFLPQLFDFMPLWLEKVVLLLGWGWFVNLYNFMDGADGLSSSEALPICAMIALVAPGYAPIAALIAGGCLGFLRVNWHPAKIFMGDVGATWLGYMLGGLLLVSCVDDTWSVIWPLAGITLVFCMDATSTLARRILQGFQPWEPHKTFWFHRYMALGHSHSQLAWAVAGVNIVLFAVGFISLKGGFPTTGFAASLLVMGGAAWYIRRSETRKKEPRHVS
jgi:UDP-N-acetylmuramyl pentapeptide phosphotransferase/UDP-N-acetylglucosamine-1-phosphate transferase